MITSQIIEKLRQETVGCQYRIHLNNAGAGLMPKIVVETMKSYLDLEAKIGGYESAELKKVEIQDFYSQVGKLLNCDTDNIAYASNATDAYARALSSIPFAKGDVILTTNDDYISNQIAFLSLKKRFNIEIVRVGNTPLGSIDLEEMQQLIWEKYPKLVAVSHIPTNSGLVQPVAEIGKICKKHNILYLVDACQSVGQMTVDVQEIGCDFLSATFRKFLRGPRGAGFLFVSNRVLKENYEPLFIDMRGAEWEEKDNYQPRKNAQRFEHWEFPYALVLGGREAVKYAMQIGLEGIEKRTFSLAKYTREKLQEIKNIAVLDRGELLCGIVTFEVQNQKAAVIKKYLDQKNINSSLSLRNYAVIDFDQKGVKEALRISPHYYNTIDEIDIFIDCLKEAV